MCTGFYYRGKDFICGFNFDVDPALWPFYIYKDKDAFMVIVTARGETCSVHGVTAKGNFAIFPYMNDFYPINQESALPKKSIELLVNDFLHDKYSFNELIDTLNKNNIVNPLHLSMHALLIDNRGDAVLVEPRCGYKEIKDNYFVVTNYPLLKAVHDESEYYGKDRYKTASEMLKNSNDDFTVKDALKILEATHQEGRWGTKVSFVYSRNERAVYYVENHDFANINKLLLKP